MLKFLRAVSKQLWKNSKLYSRWNAGRSSEIFDIEVDSRKCFLINALIAFDLVYFYSWNIVVYFIIYIYILLKNKINLKFGINDAFKLCVLLLKWIFINLFYTYIYIFKYQSKNFQIVIPSRYVIVTQFYHIASLKHARGIYYRWNKNMQFNYIFFQIVKNKFPAKMSIV